MGFLSLFKFILKWLDIFKLETIAGKEIVPASFDVDISFKANDEESIAADKDIKTTDKAVEMQANVEERIPANKDIETTDEAVEMQATANEQANVEERIAADKDMQTTDKAVEMQVTANEQFGQMKSDPDYISVEERRKLMSSGIDLRDDSSWHCIICRVNYGYDSSIYSHIQEEKHTSGIRALESEGVVRNLELCCTICDVRYSGLAIMELHLNGKKHLRRIRALERKGAKMINFEWWCTICDVRCTSLGSMEDHLTGKKHLAKAKKKKMSAWSS